MENSVVEETVDAPEAVADVVVETVKKSRKPRTEKVAEELPVENVSIGEQIVENDEGQKVIAAPKKSRAPRMSNMHTKNESGIVGSHAADSALKNAPTASAKTVKKEVDSEKVAVWSSKNIRWTGVGELSKGYNIVTKEAAEKWLTRQGIREATPEEVATYYSK
jgi:hypothetical protein